MLIQNYARPHKHHGSILRKPPANRIGSHSLSAVAPGEVRELETYSPESLLSEWIFGEHLCCFLQKVPRLQPISAHTGCCGVDKSLSNTPFSNNAAFLQLLGGAEGASLSQGSLVQHHLGHEAQSWKARNSSASLKCPSLSEACQAQLYRTQSSLILKQAYVLMHFPLQSREL